MYQDLCTKCKLYILNLLIFECTGSLLLCTGFLQLWQADSFIMEWGLTSCGTPGLKVLRLWQTPASLTSLWRFCSSSQELQLEILVSLLYDTVDSLGAHYVCAELTHLHWLDCSCFFILVSAKEMLAQSPRILCMFLSNICMEMELTSITLFIMSCIILHIL